MAAFKSGDGTSKSEGIMGEGLLQPMHLLLILAIALVLFGPQKLPALGKSLGEAIQGFKKALKDEESPHEK